MTARRWPLYVIAAAVLVGAVVLPDLQDVRRGHLPAAYAPYVLDMAPPPYDLVGVDPRTLMQASLDGLRQPRILPPVICGGHSVSGVWWTTLCTCDPVFGCTPVHCHNSAIKFSAILRDGDGTPDDGALGVTKQGNGWQLLTGPQTYTGPLSLVGPTALTSAPPATLTWSIGTGSLLCIDTDEVSDGDTPFTAASNLSVTYPTGAGTIYVDGPLTVTSGATIHVSAPPPYYPFPLVHAQGGITGTFTAGTMPSGYHLIHDSTYVRIDHN